MERCRCTIHIEILQNNHCSHHDNAYRLYTSINVACRRNLEMMVEKHCKEFTLNHWEKQTQKNLSPWLSSIESESHIGCPYIIQYSAGPRRFPGRCRPISTAFIHTTAQRKGQLPTYTGQVYHSKIQKPGVLALRRKPSASHTTSDLGEEKWFRMQKT